MKIQFCFAASNFRRTCKHIKCCIVDWKEYSQGCNYIDDDSKGKRRKNQFRNIENIITFAMGANGTEYKYGVAQMLLVNS